MVVVAAASGTASGRVRASGTSRTARTAARRTRTVPLSRVSDGRCYSNHDIVEEVRKEWECRKWLAWFVSQRSEWACDKMRTKGDGESRQPISNI